jgi:hypothetical protein
VDWYYRNPVEFVFITGFFGIRVDIIPVVCLGLSRNLLKKIQTCVYLFEEYRLVGNESVQPDRRVPTF